MESKHIVNPVALLNCVIQWNGLSARILDISFLRVVVEVDSPWEVEAPEQPMKVDCVLERHQFSFDALLKAKGEGWLRLEFEKMVPSAAAHLRSFLSPKKIGESLLEDWRTDRIRHFHGLNESELWFDVDGGVLFTYLDPNQPTSQFLIRIPDLKSTLRVGRITRKDYMELASLENEIPLLPLSDRDSYTKLGECRDIVTNFRPIGQTEYHLKQRLLKLISDNLYSTSHRVDMLTPRPHRVVTLET